MSHIDPYPFRNSKFLNHSDDKGETLERNIPKQEHSNTHYVDDDHLHAGTAFACMAD